MADLFTPVEWNDGRGGGTPATVARGARRWEAGIEAMDVAIDAHDGRIDALESALQALVDETADVVTTAQRLAIAPTEGRILVDSDLPALLIGKPGGVGWWKITLTDLTGAGSTGGPAGTTAVAQAGGTIGAIQVDAQTVVGAAVSAGRGPYILYEDQSLSGVSGATALSIPSSLRTPGTARQYGYWFTAMVGGVETAAGPRATATLPYTPPGGGGGGGGGTPATGTPAQILNMGTTSGTNHFNVGVGYSTGHVDHPLSEIIGSPPYTENPYFQPNSTGDAVQFVVFANGKTTSQQTGHPRSEMRELDPDDAHKASWLCASGSHVMSATTTIVRVPPDSEASDATARPWICFAQIHDTAISGTDPVAGTDYKGNDLIRLQMEGNVANGFILQARVHTPDAYNNRAETKIPMGSYTIGTAINWKIEVINGTAKIYIGGVVKATFALTPKGSYFKTGNYSQFSTKSGDGGYKATSYAVVELKNLVVSHS